MALMARTFLSCEKPQTDEQPPHLKPEVVPPATQDPEGDGILSVLFIGNSFTMDAVTHLPGMLKAAGIKDVHMVHMYYGGRIISQLKKMRLRCSPLCSRLPLKLFMARKSFFVSSMYRSFTRPSKSSAVPYLKYFEATFRR